MILPDYRIRALCLGRKPLLEPFEPHKVSKLPDGRKVLSYGTESFGYGIRMASASPVFLTKKGAYPYGSVLVDPLSTETSEQYFEEAYTQVDQFGFLFVVIPPGHGILGTSVERFCLPPNLKGKVVGKSSYARIMVHPLVTPLEPGWEGYLTIEVVNLGSGPVKFYLDNHGAAVVEFYEGDKPYETYGDGKYQNQEQKVYFSC